VRELDTLVAAKLGFETTYAVTGQTYPRKVDAFVLDALSGVAQSAAKFATDVRLLSRFRELREPLAEGQVGSSAQPYKANPMRSERVTALSRWLISMAANPPHTAATQWLERTLDDSANRRLSLSEAFLTADAILRIVHNVADGLMVYPAMVRRNLAAELPFMASEAILMSAVQRGGDRQQAHERLRIHSRAATDGMLTEGADNDFLHRVAGDPEIPLDADELNRLLDPHRFVGRAPQQTREFLAEVVQPILDGAGELPAAKDLDV
jgi:adenylosuccinate lyase